MDRLRRRIREKSGADYHIGVDCETCAFYTYDQDYEDYVCDVDMDEDEYARFLSDRHYHCPYYRNGDEYAVVRHQM